MFDYDESRGFFASDSAPAKPWSLSLAISIDHWQDVRKEVREGHKLLAMFWTLNCNVYPHLRFF
jgi:hypothetical protein